MNILNYLIFFGAGFISFLTYSIGICEGIKLLNKEDIKIIPQRKSEHIQKETEKEFISQYNELMNYDFDKAGESDE